MFHDGFVAAATTVATGGWDGFLPGADRVAIDQHPYLCFAQPNTDGLSYQAAKVCLHCSWGLKLVDCASSSWTFLRSPVRTSLRTSILRQNSLV